MEKGEKKKGFAERFEEAFRKSMKQEHEEYQGKEPKFDPGKGVVDVVEPEGEKHFDL